MDFGIVLPTRADSWAVAQRAETLGVSHAWFYDTALLNAEIFVAMGAAAVKTSSIILATGVLTPSNRLAPVAASGLAALNQLAPGRVAFGAGTGFTGRRTLGQGPMTLAALETYVRQVEALLRGERIDFVLEGQSARTGFLDPSPPIMNISDPIPTHISAFGPKGRKLTARLGAGWLGSVGTPASEAEAIAAMHAAWRDEGHDPTTMHATLVGSGSVLDDDEPADSVRARAEAGPLAAVAFHELVERYDSLNGADAADHFPFKEQLAAYRKVYKAYRPADERHLANHKGHMMALRPEETHIDGAVIRGMTLTGTRRELAERLRGIRDSGYDQLAISLPPGHEDTMLERWSEVFAAL
ncbi:MAG: LLM class flavin-dependent oxidoreductase [Novosphingobium sp.]|nr:LLM class flavin-dependent oxidoreductase [Novosphingobium sp.]MCP5402659.1 LLM class flavin-dependent oxidoreductase [Novosphingobium sp.]